MIRKPPAAMQRSESAAVGTVRTAVGAARGGVKVARAGGHFVRGLLCFLFAAIWGFAALAGGLIGGSLPTFIGVGAMAAFMAWAGRRAFAKARDIAAGEEPVAVDASARAASGGALTNFSPSRERLG